MAGKTALVRINKVDLILLDVLVAMTGKTRQELIGIAVRNLAEKELEEDYERQRPKEQRD